MGDFLKELHLTEGRNTGMAKILRAMRQNGSPDPVFETDAERLYFLTTLPVHPAFQPAAGGAPRIPANPGATTRDDASPEDVLLSYLLEHPTATNARIAHDLGVSTSTVTRRISTLKLEGKIRREGSARNGRWVAGEGRL